jgi:NhaA family Na+:H+ antiporter
VGKQIGVFGATWVLVKFFSPDISPQRETWKVIYGIAVLCGIGFTMSIFVSNLSFADPALLEFSKIGVLAGSLVSGLAGYFLLSSKTQYEAESQKSLNVPE